MRPKQHQTTGSGDLFRARLDQIINMKHELIQLAAPLGRRAGNTCSNYFARFQMTTVEGPPPEGAGCVYFSSSPVMATLVRF